MREIPGEFFVRSRPSPAGHMPLELWFMLSPLAVWAGGALIAPLFIASLLMESPAGFMVSVAAGFMLSDMPALMVWVLIDPAMAVLVCARATPPAATQKPADKMTRRRMMDIGNISVRVSGAGLARPARHRRNLRRRPMPFRHHFNAWPFAAPRRIRPS